MRLLGRISGVIGWQKQRAIPGPYPAVPEAEADASRQRASGSHHPRLAIDRSEIMCRHHPEGVTMDMMY